MLSTRSVVLIVVLVIVGQSLAVLIAVDRIAGHTDERLRANAVATATRVAKVTREGQVTACTQGSNPDRLASARGWNIAAERASSQGQRAFAAQYRALRDGFARRVIVCALAYPPIGSGVKPQRVTDYRALARAHLPQPAR